MNSSNTSVEGVTPTLYPVLATILSTIITENGSLVEPKTPTDALKSETYSSDYTTFANETLDMTITATVEHLQHGNVTYEQFTVSPFHNMTTTAKDNATMAQMPPCPILLTEEQQLSVGDVQFWIDGILTFIVVVLGLTGNVLTMTILTKPKMKSSTNAYLLALAIWDSVVLLSSLLLLALPQTIASYSHYFPDLVPIVYPIGLTGQTATIWLMVCVAVERYIAVCHPLKANRMCTIKRARIIIILVSFLSLIYNICRIFEYSKDYVIDHETNKTIPILKLTELYTENDTYKKVYYTWLYIPILCFIPIGTLAVLNTFLVRAVHKSQQQQQTMHVRQTTENNSVTIMLVCVVIVFIVCQFPALVYNVAWSADYCYVDYSYGWMILSSIRNFLVSINSAVNFILYCALGQKFRRLFMFTYFRCCMSQRSLAKYNKTISGFTMTTTVNMASVNAAKKYARALKQNQRNIINNRSPNSTYRHGQNNLAITPELNRHLTPEHERLNISSDSLNTLQTVNGSIGTLSGQSDDKSVVETGHEAQPDVAEAGVYCIYNGQMMDGNQTETYL